MGKPLEWAYTQSPQVVLRDGANPETFRGLQGNIIKLTRQDQKVVMAARSKLDLDTDGKDSKRIFRWDGDHQDETTLDPKADGVWLESDLIPYFVLPGGFAQRHGGIKIGMLGTLFYNDHHIHCVYADVGPAKKFGEGSIAAHRGLGIELVSQDGVIINSGIDGNVELLMYLGSCISTKVFDAHQIQVEGEALWQYWRKP